MLSRKFRFHGYNALDSVYRRGKSVRGQFMMLRYTPNPRRKNYRVAVVVSKKVHKSAVIRNRIRRRIFELVRQHSDKIPAVYDLVFTVFDESVAAMPPAELEKAVVTQLKSLPKTAN
jgi:ribonuclease P protein component